MPLNLTDFLTRRPLKIKIPYPPQLEIFKKKGGATNWHLQKQGNHHLIRYQWKGEQTEQTFETFLTQRLAPTERMTMVHNAIVDYYSNQNSFREGLPIYLIRRHGSRAGEEGRSMRRRGWLVKFNNAYIVYADNFFSRHLFESAYIVSSASAMEIAELINTFTMPFSSGGGTEEKRHRLFPALNHLTATSGLYLSHIYDLNQGAYRLSSEPIEAKTILGRGKENRFGCGEPKNWDAGEVVTGDKKCRIIPETLCNDTLSFLQAYNIRTLSPLNYFPFPKSALLNPGSLDGEDEGPRENVIGYYTQTFGEAFSSFQSIARTAL